MSPRALRARLRARTLARAFPAKLVAPFFWGSSAFPSLFPFFFLFLVLFFAEFAHDATNVCEFAEIRGPSRASNRSVGYETLDAITISLEYHLHYSVCRGTKPSALD